jgi:Tfp pilus assembly protein PilN
MRAVNLIPAEQRGGASVGAGRSGGGAYAVVALLGGLAVLALIYGSARNQISSRRSQAAELATQAQQAQAAASELAPYTSFITLREARMHAFTQLVDSRFDWAHVFHEFGRVLPPEVSISSLNGTVGSASPTTSSSSSSSGAAAASPVVSATPPGTVPTFTLAGCATSQPAVALMLERLRLIDGVDEVVLQSSTKSSSGASGSGAGSGSCPPHAVSFAAEVNFDPLPASSPQSSAAKAVADTTQGATK